MAIELVATKNGPYLLTGDLSGLDLRDGDGNLYDVAGKSRIFLCRCGASTTKPFCIAPICRHPMLRILPCAARSRPPKSA